MQPEGDFEQIRRHVFDSAQRLLDARRPEQPPVTISDVAADIGADLPLVVKAVQSLAEYHLDVRAGDDWQMAEIREATRAP